MMDMKNSANHDASEALALSALSEMPVFSAFEPMDFQRMLELMQEPVHHIDHVIGKEAMRKICKQLLTQNLALQTTVRNLQIQLRDSAQAFEDGMNQLDAAVKKYTEFEGIEHLMIRVAAEQDANVNQGQLALSPDGATHYDDAASKYVALDSDGCCYVWEDGVWGATEPSDEWVKTLRKLDA